MLVLPSRSEKFSKRKHQQNFFKFLLILVVIAVGGYKLLFNYAKNTASQNINSSSSSVETVVTHQASKVDWQSPSEKKPYPDVNAYPNMWVKVSTSKHRVYLMNGNKVLYTMLCSTGSKGQETPKGTFEIQAERGDHFYNAQSGEGANYWVSFKDHVIFSIQFQLMLTVIMSFPKLNNWENQVILMVVYAYLSQMLNGFMKILKQEQKLLLNNKKLPVQKPVAFCLVCEIF